MTNYSILLDTLIFFIKFVYFIVIRPINDAMSKSDWTLDMNFQVWAYPTRDII